jgi:hypothetical protein
MTAPMAGRTMELMAEPKDLARLICQADPQNRRICRIYRTVLR